MEVKVNHKLAQQEAFQKAQNMMSELRAEYGDKVQDLKEEWSGNQGKYTCSFNGMKLVGTIEVTNNDVIVKGSVPFFALPFSGIIEDAIRKNVEKALNK